MTSAATGQTGQTERPERPGPGEQAAQPSGERSGKAPRDWRGLLGRLRRKATAWVAVAATALAALGVAVFDDGAPRSNAERAQAIAENFACPVCAGQSVAESDVVVARNIRREIRVWVDEGRSEEFIRAQLVAIYGDDIDYTPAASGLASVIWVLPVVTAAAAAVAVAALFSRSRPAPPQPAGADAPRAPPGEQPSSSRRAVWVLAALLLAVLAGALVARSSGSRSDSDAITGDIRATARELLLDAQQAFGRGDPEGALDIYDEVLELSPANTEALAYSAWLLRISGDSEAAEPLIADAVAIDPDYPDARVFAAAIAMDMGDSAAAAAHLEAFDRLDPPEFMRRLVADQGLRDAVDEASRAAALRRVEAWQAAGGRGSFAEAGIGAGELVLAAEALAAEQRLIEGLELLQEALLEQPDSVALNVGYGWLLGRSAAPGSPEPAGIGLSYLDRALAIEPEDPEGLVYRAFLRVFVGDVDGGRADLAAFDALEVRPAGLADLIDDFGLRRQLEASEAADS